MLATKGNNMGRPLAARGFNLNANAETTDPHIDAFLAAAHRRKYPAKSTLIYAGDKSDSIYYVLKGSVTVLVEDHSGREIIVAYLNKGDFFGEMSLLNEKPRTATATALDEVKALELDWETFKRRIKKYNVIAIHMIQTLSQRLADTLHVVDNLFRPDASSRIVRELTEIIDQETQIVGGKDCTVSIEVDVDELHRITGLEIETVQQELEKLGQLNLLKQSDDGLQVPSVKALHAYLKKLESLQMVL